jgi:hypothetical protein
LALLEALVCFEEDCVLRTEVLNRDHSALAVPLAEYLGVAIHACAYWLKIEIEPHRFDV